jgi:hypothetical protein
LEFSNNHSQNSRIWPIPSHTATAIICRRHVFFEAHQWPYLFKWATPATPS